MKWNAVQRLATPLALMAMLAACGTDKPAAPPQATASASSAADAPAALPVVGEERRIVALGDSLFAGYGLDPSQSYPVRIEGALRARGINAKMTNAGVSGDTTAGGLQRVDFVIDSMDKPPQLVLISLGGNDMLRGLPPEETRKNLAAILGKLKARGIPVVLMGMLAPPNLGADYAAKFNPIYPALAKEYGARLVPFFLQPVVGRTDLIQADRIHPNDAGVTLLVTETIDQIAGALPVSPAAPPAPR